MAINKNLNIYLSGAMTCTSITEMKGWRNFLKARIEECASNTDCNVSVINPCDYYNFEEVRHQSEKEIMDYDLALTKKSDVVIVNTLGLNTSIGSAIELYEAYKRDIPIIAYDELNIFSKLHPWLQTYITRVENCAVDLCEYLKDFYFV